MGCKLVYIEAAVLHAGLNDAERIDLVKKFNSAENKLTVSIIMYQVGSIHWMTDSQASIWTIAAHEP